MFIDLLDVLILVLFLYIVCYLIIFVFAVIVLDVASLVQYVNILVLKFQLVFLFFVYIDVNM